MRAVFTSLVALIVADAAVVALGQTPPSSLYRKASDEERTPQIVLYPMPAPQPALKYQLLPPFPERTPGNAAVVWNRLPAERTYFLRDLFHTKDPEWDRIEKWMGLSLGTAEETKQRAALLAKRNEFVPRSLFDDMQRAARFESCDWQLPIREGNFLEMTLSEVQQTRLFALLLAADVHLEIAEGRYEQAIRALQVGYAQARDIAQGPTLINALVGTAVAGIMSEQLQQLIQQPDAPNLYWALSTLPQPLVDFRPGGEAESNFLYLQFPALRGLDDKELSAEGWQSLLEQVQRDVAALDTYLASAMGQKSPPKPAPSAEDVYPRAKRFLVEQGRTAAEVEAMPMAQAVLLYSVHAYNVTSDEQWKWFFLPAAEVGTRLRAATKAYDEAKNVDLGIFSPATFSVAVMAAKGADTRCQWNLALLRVFEALRLHAGSHEGRWPDRLSDIDEVPVPLNPYDGKPFTYERKDDKAILTMEAGPPLGYRRYEITLMPKAK